MTVGGGGREHAMMLAFEQPGLEQLSTQPNAGMAELGKDLGTSDVSDIVWLASGHNVDFVAVGPEAPLAAGLADRLRQEGIPVLGFGAQAAKLESGKAFAADFADEYGILAPDYKVANNLADAESYITRHHALEYVIKAEGLAGGHGVFLPEAIRQARQTTRDMMSGKLFGEAGKRIVFQERLTGREVSMFALLDGKKAKVLYTAQDHKRLLDGDKGPNTGGMGAYSPVPPSIVSEKQVAKMHETLAKTLDGMDHRGINSPGILYLGFMLADKYDGDPVLIEYNARLGDPEAQVILPLLGEAGVNVHDLFYTAARGGLEGDRLEVIEQSGRAALTVCLAGKGYTESPHTREVIHGLDRTYPDVIVHHGATKRIRGERILSTGGRVLYVTGLGETVSDAAAHAYAAIGNHAINFAGMQYRTDIGHQAIVG